MRKSYMWAVIIAGGLSLWMASPYLVSAFKGHSPTEDEAAVAEKAAAKPPALFRVRVKSFVAVERAAAVTATGITQASSKVDVLARTPGTIIEQNGHQGDAMKTGTVLCRLDNGVREAQLQQVTTALAAAKRDYEASQKLVNDGIASKKTLFTQQAAVDAAQAAEKNIEQDISYLTIKAPTEGVLIDKPAQPGGLLVMGGLCASISKLDPLLVVVQVSERDIRYLAEGMHAEAELATGEKVEGTITYIARAADKATRTLRVELEVANPDYKMRDGITADLVAKLPSQLAQKIPGSLIILDEKGEPGVRVLEEDHSTRFAPVTITQMDVDGMWVAGLPPKVTLVTVGQDFVSDGETVDPVVETAEAKP